MVSWRQLDINSDGDLKSATRLSGILKDGKKTHDRLAKMIRSRTVIVVGAGPSLHRSLGKLKEVDGAVIIAADSALGAILDRDIIPDVVVTDLDGSSSCLAELSQSECIFVVHAHGDNISKLGMAATFRHSIGTSQTRPPCNIYNFGGFTDGDRAVFLADHFGARRIILVGMDFGKKIGRHSDTAKPDRRLKLQKLRLAEEMLESLSQAARSELYTTSRPIKGFKKIPLEEIDRYLE